MFQIFGNLDICRIQLQKKQSVVKKGWKKCPQRSWKKFHFLETKKFLPHTWFGDSRIGVKKPIKNCFVGNAHKVGFSALAENTDLGSHFHFFYDPGNNSSTTRPFVLPDWTDSLQVMFNNTKYAKKSGGKSDRILGLSPHPPKYVSVDANDFWSLMKMCSFLFLKILGQGASLRGAGLSSAVECEWLDKGVCTLLNLSVFGFAFVPWQSYGNTAGKWAIWSAHRYHYVPPSYFMSVILSVFLGLCAVQTCNLLSTGSEWGQHCWGERW